MFTNLTEPEKSQGRKKVRRQMRGGVGRKGDTSEEEEREKRGTDKTLDNTRLFSLCAHLILHALHQMLSLFHTLLLSSLILLPQKVLEVYTSISTNTSLTAWIKPWRQHQFQGDYIDLLASFSVCIFHFVSAF